MKRLLLGSKYRIIFSIAVAGILAAAATWTTAKSNTPPSGPAGPSDAATGPGASNPDPRWSKAILTVSNMTCGGCIGTVKKSVAGLSGTGNVNVDLAASTAEVLYDNIIVTDPQAIADAITDGGYPAKIQRLISSRQLGRESIEASDLAKTHIAKVGRIDIPREDFEIELAHASSRYQSIYGDDLFTTPQGKQLLERLQSQIARRLIDEAVKFQEIDRTGYSIKEKQIDSAMLAYAKEKNVTLAKLESDLENNGYPFDHFKSIFARRITLQSYLEENVFPDSVDPDDRQQRYKSWLANARSLAKVVYYDKALETIVKAGGGVGCSGGGGNCSVSR